MPKNLNYTMQKTVIINLGIPKPFPRANLLSLISIQWSRRHRRLRYVSAWTQEKREKQIKAQTLQQQYPAVIPVFFETFSKS